jgi:3D (Asp-Asp-Asp) domain-containing protein
MRSQHARPGPTPAPAPGASRWAAPGGDLLGNERFAAAAAAAYEPVKRNRQGPGYRAVDTDGLVLAPGQAHSYGSLWGRLPAGTAREGGSSTAAAAPPQPARTYLGTFMVTCYDLTGVTASGAMAGPDSVAVDPTVIPLGTQIFVDGVGQRTADDTGGGIIGDHVDIWEPTYSQCINWGVQQRAVYRIGADR